MKYSSHQGFTLIELVVVIIILGILAVTAAPKFINLTNDATKASLEGLQGSIKSANALVYSKAAIDSQEKLNPGEIELNGVKIMTIVGYIAPTAENLPKAIDGLFAELSNPTDSFTEDWGLYNIPNAGVFIFPQGHNINSDCHLHYNVTATGTEPAFFNLVSNGC
ncbi:prepilin-type N-terminal cleavage/methylation domain-containing protein [Shewanella sp. 1CM18E]|uniref:prepilin-type N-terminal cleavage/methylation domain-containing protein n=1 Tax=Shewanella sp. 1CM18E TaxID=2929169 RepID=UPI00249F4866|nr:prepilin-type N-terminal cleavage/methylation domain-containing protein [Shewanella sp. 1CM18E]